ncbi:transcriptional regulator, TetR family [Leptospira ryugenii]|uniref:Transcriptional regulator, TetR family n=1 Tax=Leptospira ryugenii TaxID=1917863 RepID=A0A2P2E4M4_9LEPT|nr:TetR/AcrR family transcriptional regulator [Leptospira ryugenii]GBF51812.1 transcriptional regulator, TetR family [Leptospira ryugenii]
MSITENKKLLAREKSIEKIRNSAIHLFSKHGFSATTMEMIAKHAKVSKGLAYNYFRSKNQIFEMILDQHLSKQEAIYRTIPENSPPVQYLQEFFQKSLEFMKQEKKTMILISVCLYQPSSVALSKRMIDNFERRLAPFRESLKRKFKSLGIQDLEAEFLFVRVFLHGIFSLDCAHHSELGYEEKLVDLFLSRYGACKSLGIGNSKN